MQNPLELICKLFQFQEFTLIKVNICVCIQHQGEPRILILHVVLKFSYGLDQSLSVSIKYVESLLLMQSQREKFYISSFFKFNKNLIKLGPGAKFLQVDSFLFPNILNSVKLFPTNTTVETKTSKNNLNVANQRKWKRSMLKYLCQYKQFYLQ